VRSEIPIADDRIPERILDRRILPVRVRELPALIVERVNHNSLD